MIHFVGAGPGAADLITVRGARMIRKADVIIYAGSLVSAELLEEARKDCRIYDSSRMTLEEILAVMQEAEAQNQTLVRLHTGEPSLYGAIHEQMNGLDALGIPYDSTPGVTAAFGAAASLNLEYTIPEVSQTLIVTRMEGRTPVPEKEGIAQLASHQTSMAIYLSAGQAEALRKELLAGGYRADTPVAVVYKATWEEEKKIYSTLDKFSSAMDENGITNHAVILVGEAIGYSAGWREWHRTTGQWTDGNGGCEWPEKEGTDAGYGLRHVSKHRSKLYDPSFSTGFRQAKDGEKLVDGLGVLSLNIISFTDMGDELARKLADQLEAESESMAVSLFPVAARQESLSQIVKSSFDNKDALLFIGAMGICVRLIAPHIKDKTQDIPVLVMDEKAEHIVPVLSGHIGGANRLAEYIAGRTGAQAVLTTATDVQGVFAVDVWAAEQGLFVANKNGIQKVSAKLLAGESVTLTVRDDRYEIGEDGLPEGVSIVPWDDCRKRYGREGADGHACSKDLSKDDIISVEDDSQGKKSPDSDDKVNICIVQVDHGCEQTGKNIDEIKSVIDADLYLCPKRFVLGIGCKKGILAEKLDQFAKGIVSKAGIGWNEIAVIATIDRKAKEEGLVTFCRRNRLRLVSYSAETLASVQGNFAGSVFVEKTVGVDNVCERAAAAYASEKSDEWRQVVAKTAKDGMTAAVYEFGWHVSFR